MMRSSLFIVCPFLCSVESFRYCFLQLAFGSAGFFERSAKSLFGLRLCARLGLAFLPCSAVRCHFEPFAKRRKIHALRCNLHFKFMDTSLSLSMTKQVSMAKKQVSMTRTLSLREFAKRERANSWQSKGKFAFKFIDCHANFAKICSQ